MDPLIHANTAIPGFTEPFSSLSHLATAVGALVGGVILVKKGRGNPVRITALVVYTVSLIFLFSMSGVFHLLDRDTTARAVFQRLDHAGIWVLIAGTFTPVHVILFRGPWRWAVLLLVWICAITGLVLEVVFFKSIPFWLSLSLYLGLGWMGALTGYKFRKSFHGESLHFLVNGGLFYSFGALMEHFNWPTIWPHVIEPHDVFHAFVVLGAYYHWRFVEQWSDHPIANTITFNVSIFPTDHFKASAADDHLFIEAGTLTDLKQEIRWRVRDKYHESIQPRIRLRYFQEETL